MDGESVMNKAEKDTLELAREICAEQEGENKGYQYINGSRDDYPMMLAVLKALRAHAENADDA